MDSIENIAGRHLGKAGDGTQVNPYVTPDAVDASLLVAIPRQLNRTQYNIAEDALPFVGFDTWHAYEVSFLLSNGYPINCTAKIVYSSDSPFIVESKSLKLYLNSYNMQILNGSAQSAIDIARAAIQADLENLLNTNVDITLHETVQLPWEDVTTTRPIEGYFDILDLQCEREELPAVDFTEYQHSVDILEAASVDSGYYCDWHRTLKVWSPSLRSNCRVTNQPDWGDVFIYMKAPRKRDSILPTRESLLKYIISMRKENHFHEEIAECIYTQLHETFNPVELFVACLYTRRGGIDINPVRASSSHLLHMAAGLRNTALNTTKTVRQ
jgi:7-cyano-7-deazaguanine reductase